jgi:hypothetical protein
MRETLFEGKVHKITTDGQVFFLYHRTDDEWELRDSNSVDRKTYKEVLRDLKKIFSMNMPEEDKILKICESGFFSVSNL